MAQTAFPAPQHVTARRRAFFGLFNADGWPWAIVKGLFWFVLIIVILGYIPDRAYYFTVQKTVDLGVLAWSPVNLCPPGNETLPCPAPVGATLPWHPGPGEVSLPAPRTDGVAGVIGQAYLYAGGSDGAKAATDTYVSHAVGSGNIDKWSAGPSLPEARADAASIVVGNTLYVIGGFGPDGKPTSTVFSLTIANDGTIGAWATEAKVALPEPRAGSSAVAVSDGIVVMGGTDGTAATRSVWKSRADKAGKLTAWVSEQPLLEENMDGVAVHVGDVISVIGGRNKDGAVVATVQQGLVGGPSATTANPNAVAAWRASPETNLPGPRTNMSGFTANGVIYVQGGSDGVSPRTETLWTTPDAGGVIPAWQHLAQVDLGEGVEGSSAAAAGSHAFAFGGSTASGPTAGVARTNLAPQEPFFQLGILGATIPALKLDGEIGQQIGYLNAATVGAINFILLILVGWGFAHKEKVRAFIANRRRGRG
jgi:N-acetylneuraminic acid mutarotase